MTCRAGRPDPELAGPREQLWYTAFRAFRTRSEVGYSQDDPVDHERTFRRHAGETVTHGANAPGVYGVIVAAGALVIGLCAFATGHIVAGSTAVILAAVLGAASAAWLARSHRKVRDAELRWHAENSDEPAPPPSS